MPDRSSLTFEQLTAHCSPEVTRAHLDVLDPGEREQILQNRDVRSVLREAIKWQQQEASRAEGLGGGAIARAVLHPYRERSRAAQRQLDAQVSEVGGRIVATRPFVAIAARLRATLDRDAELQSQQGSSSEHAGRRQSDQASRRAARR